MINTFETIIDGILNDGYGITDNFITSDEVAALASQLHQRWEAGKFKAAGTGNQEIAVSNTVRGDEILWLDDDTIIPIEVAFLLRIREFMAYVNQTCYLGLRDIEFHYALYPTGTFYKRHLDRFRSDSRRKLSVICYLNTEWQEADGGQLAIYLPGIDSDVERQITISPMGGRLVCFDSGLLPHEVLPATHERLSITGWLKTSG